jgi:hypothetical protein
MLHCIDLTFFLVDHKERKFRPTSLNMVYNLCLVFILGSFATLQSACQNCSVLLSVRMDLYEIWFLVVILTFVDMFKSWSKSVRGNHCVGNPRQRIPSQPHNYVGNPPWWRHNPARQAPDSQVIDCRKLWRHWCHSHSSRGKFWRRLQNCYAMRAFPNLFVQ